MLFLVLVKMLYISWLFLSPSLSLSSLITIVDSPPSLPPSVITYLTAEYCSTTAKFRDGESKIAANTIFKGVRCSYEETLG